MHKEVSDFIHRMRARFPKGFDGGEIVEFGSLNVNGTPRPFFLNATSYTGVDWRRGRGVDVVALAHEYKAPNGHFDFAISTEMLEHDPYWLLSLRNMMRVLKKGGCLLITCAGPGRHAHDVATSPAAKYYCNRTMRELLDAIYASHTFKIAVLEDDSKAHDIRFFGWRKR